MAGYKFTTFDGVTLPEYNPIHNLTPSPVRSTLQRSIGGVFDRYGSDRRLPDLHTIEYTGEYIGEIVYVIDHDGDFNIDHNGDFWIGGDSSQWLRNQVDALVEKEGVRGQLVRQRLDDSVNQWKQARLLSVNWRSETDDNCVIAEVRPRFEIAKGAWRDESATASNDVTTAGGIGEMTIHNGGMIPVHDATIDIYSSSPIRSIRITTDNGVDWTFSDIIPTGDHLVIDCGAQTVLLDGVDAYSGFTLNAGHTADGWLPLERGYNAITIVADVLAIVTISHYNQWL